MFAEKNTEKQEKNKKVNVRGVAKSCNTPYNIGRPFSVRFFVMQKMAETR